MIEQQYYTRERGGLFSERDGYDSIAKSSGLRLDFIKKNIHPLCQYDSPSELQKNSEPDEKSYPPSFIIMPVPSGEMIVGQAVYKSKDFTGLRSTFFMHNYVFSGAEKQDLMRYPAKLFGIIGFVNQHDIHLGKELPSLEEVPFDKAYGVLNGRKSLMETLGITEALFKKMLYAIYVAAISKKKVYINLDVPIQQLTHHAKALLYHLYTYLPTIILKDLGVSTYSRTPEAKKGIHIMFVEKGAIRQGDSKVEKELVFDFVNQRFLNVDVSVEDNKYFELAFKYAANEQIWEMFNEFIEKVAAPMDSNEGKSLGFHHNLALLFELQLYMRSQKEYSLEYKKDRAHLLKNTAVYINLSKDEKTRRQLIEIVNYVIPLFEKRLEYGELLDFEEINEVIKFKQHISPDAEGLIKLLIHDLKQALNGSQYPYIKEVLARVRQDEKLYVEVFKQLYVRDELRQTIAYRVIDDTFKDIKVLEKFIAAMNALSPIEILLQEDGYYQKASREALSKCMQNGMKNVEDQVKLLKTMQTWCAAKSGRIYDLLLQDCEDYFLKTIELKMIESEKELLELHFKKRYTQLNYDIIELYKSFKNQTFSSSEVKDILLEKTQELIKKYYKRSDSKDDFQILIYGFLRLAINKYGEKNLSLDLKAVLSFLYARDVNTLIDFIIWSKEQKHYINQASFDKEVVQYFLKLKVTKHKVPKKALKDKLGENSQTKRLYRKIKESQQSQLTRFMNQHKRAAAGVGVLLIFCMSIGGYSIYQSAMQRDDGSVEEPLIDAVNGEIPMAADKSESGQDNLDKELTNGGTLNTQDIDKTEEVDQSEPRSEANDVDNTSPQNSAKNNESDTQSGETNEEGLNTGSPHTDDLNQEEVEQQ